MVVDYPVGLDTDVDEPLDYPAHLLAADALEGVVGDVGGAVLAVPVPADEPADGCVAVDRVGDGGRLS